METTTLLATVLDARRKELGLSYAALATAAGIGHGSAHRCLTGDATIAAATAAKLGRALGLSATALGRLLYDTFPGPESGVEKISKKIPDTD